MSNRANRRTVQEQYNLIMECRSSGLSDAQWCQDHNINPGTFYNWVSRLRKNGCQDLPVSTGKSIAPEPAQDIVKMEIIPETKTTSLFMPETPVASRSNIIADAPIEITLANTTIRITNDVDPRLFAQILRQLGGALC